MAVCVEPGAVGDGARLADRLPASPGRYGIDLAELASRLRLKGAPGDAGVVTLPRFAAPDSAPPWRELPETVVLLGVGDSTPTSLRRAGAALARATDGFETVVAPVGGQAGAVAALAEGYLLAAYRPPRRGRTPGPARPASRLVLLTELASGHDSEVEAAAEAAVRRSSATWTARRLTATPSNLKSPAWFAQEAILAGAEAGFDVAVHDAAWLAQEGLRGLLAVGSGSAHEPRLVVASHEPAPGAGTAPNVVLVGKGITFDTGGLSLKPRDAMIPMKTDMAGAAVVLAAVAGAARMGLGIRVTGVMPLAENALGAGSYRPGDVLTMHDGSTVEVRNTDAEGRLVLADGLSWSRRLDPDVILDIATLTGAATLGLGRRHAALYATDDDLADALQAAGESSGERVWRMPLVADYERALDSSVADVANVATDPHVKAGSITAALFLRRFVRATPWAHLDIAGPARAGKTEHEVTEGATGFGARLVLRWLESLSA